MKRTVVVALVGLVMLSGFVWMCARIYAWAQEREVTYRYISEALDPVDPRAIHLQWKEAEATLARSFTNADAIQIGQAIEHAWHILSLTQDTNRPELLEEVFMGVALDRALVSVEDATRLGGRMAILDIDAQPVFFHRDGSTFQAKLTMTVARYNASDEGDPIRVLSRDTGTITLLNQSTGWTVIGYEAQEIDPIASVTIDNWQSPHLKGINYYPAETPWRDFWPNFDPERIQMDLDRVRALEANALRIFLPVDDVMDPDRREQTLADLERFLALCEETELMVVPTLFDLKGDYGPATWSNDTLYLSKVLPILSASKSVAFIDIKNEPDLDYATFTPRTIQAWIYTMITYARQTAPEMAYTVGWSNAERAGDLADTLELITYHDYAALDETNERFDAVRAISADKPVMITEIGASSWSLARGFPSSPVAQADHLESRLDGLTDADGVFIWALSDFSNIDAAAIGGSPWAQNLQSEYGLFRVDGREKPSAAIVRHHFEGKE